MGRRWGGEEESSVWKKREHFWRTVEACGGKGRGGGERWGVR
jgi:hypothetical protein